MKKIFIQIILCSSFLFSFNVKAAIKETELFNSFVDNMVNKHQFDSTELKKLFQAVNIQQKIIDTMKKPAEGLAWHKYRKIFMTETRIKEGVEFWQKHEAVLTSVEEKYGIPAEIIIAILGVETKYGQNTGNDRVIDALSTLAFNYPKRSKFFLRELESFLILCREEKMNPLEPMGSYAGAMGLPQFMPSSYRAYAADYENDQKKDIWNNPADAMASIANYFVEHHWQKGAGIVFPVTAKGDGYKQVLTKGLKPDFTWGEVQARQVTGKNVINNNEMVKLLSFQQEQSQDLWVGLNNFYVITRYNHSPLYAMAVFQLSEAIVKEKQLNQSEKMMDKKK